MQLQPPEKPRNVAYFVDRQDYSRDFLKLLQNSDVIDIVAETEATYGTGKTTILSDLYETVARSEEFRAIWMPLSLYSLHHLNPDLVKREWNKGDLKESPAVLAQNYVSYHLLIQNLCQVVLGDESLSKNLTGDSLSILSQIGNVDEVHLDGSIEQWQAAAQRVAARPGAIQPRIFLREIDRVVDTITQQFLERYNQLQNNRRSVVFADDYCWIYDQPIGDWVMKRLSNEMKNTVLFVSHTGLDEGHEIESVIKQERSVKPLRLTNFTPEEVGEYLEKRLPWFLEDRRALLNTLPDAVYYFSGGHAQTVCLIADLLEYGDPENLPDLSPRSAAKPQELVFELVQRLIDETRDPWLQEALQYAGLTRRFDGDLIHTVLLNTESYAEALKDEIASRAGENPDEIDLDALEEDDTSDDVRNAAEYVRQEFIHRILEKLERFSFVNHYTDERASSYFTLHFLVQEHLSTWLSDNDPERYSRMHADIANYYKDILTGYEEQKADASNYVKCYRYEDRIWQLNMSEWLYHLSFQTQEEARRQAQLDFVTLYIGALQWWHWYIPFEFTRHLLTMWETTQLHDDEVFEWIKELDKNYPHGYFNEKQGNPGWKVVIDVYEKFMDYFEFDAFNDDAVEGMDEDERFNLTCLLEQYGMAFRFGPPRPNYVMAETIWKRAIEIAEIDEDVFSSSYFWAYLSHMYLEIGRLEEAEEAANTILTFDELGDYRAFDADTDCEVLSLAYLMLALITLRQGRWPEAQQHSLAMTLCAYAQNFGGVTGHPDPYTTSWQRDICDDLFQNLIEAWQSGHTDEVEAIVAYIYDGWANFRRLVHIEAPAVDVRQALRAGDRTALAAYLLPPEIRLDDPNWNDLYYLNTHLNNLRQALAAVDIQETP
jgi:hypothetical protein